MTNAPITVGHSSSITDGEIDRARRAIGREFPHRCPAWNQSVDSSSIGHFAYGYGDDNPLWHSRPYGRRTRWCDQIAPPLYLLSAGNDTLATESQSHRPPLRGLFKGTTRLHVRSSWTWYHPVYAGDLVFRSRRRLSRVVAVGRETTRAVRQSYDVAFVNHAGVMVARQVDTFVNIARRIRDSGPENGDQVQAGRPTRAHIARYGPRERQQIDDCYAGAESRGGEVRSWQTVQPGDEFPPLVKGPLTVVEIISMHQGMGWGGMPVGPHKYGWQGRQKSPGFYELDDDGVYQVIQRIHWDTDYARRTGFQAPYDYGQMRACWMSQAITDWMGDDGWLWKLTVDYKRLNLLGDTQWCTGRVVQRRIVRGHHVVVVSLAATNQRGEVTTAGTATVLLPPDELSGVRLPRPSVSEEADTLRRFDFARPHSKRDGQRDA